MIRLIRFHIVGLAGAFLQLGALSLLHDGLGLHHLLATALAVEFALLHNYCWHRKWTWRERQAGIESWLRFQFTTGLISLGGNLAGTQIFASMFAIPPLAANLLVICSMWGVNFLLADRYVFPLR